MVANGSPGSADLALLLGQGPDTFPFRRALSLGPLIEFWRGDGTACEGTVCAALGSVVSEAVARAPELMSPITDVAVLEKHVDIVDALMAAIFPPAAWEQAYVAALVPFDLVSFYETPAFRRDLLGDDRHVRGRLNLDAETMRVARLRFAYKVVLERVYGIKLDLDYPLMITVADPDTGLERHFGISFDPTFQRVHVVGERPPLPETDRMRLQAAFLDVEALLQLLPPERFMIEGFTIMRAVDVTDQEVLSSIKRDLIDRESIVSHTKFGTLQAKLRTLFRRPELQFSLAALDGARVLILNYGAELEHSCIFADSAHHDIAEFLGTVYERTVKSELPIIIDDLAAKQDRHPIEDQLVAAGTRGLVVAPLHYQNRVIGTLELGSPVPGDFTPLHLPKLHEILPLFAMAVQRSIEELNTRVQAFIKEKCTAIHPTVEWRFRRAVLDTLERQRDNTLDGQTEMEAIVFPDVHPLYALADIRGTSTQRALAIQTDLLSQLRLAAAVIDQAHRAKLLPALDELRYRIARIVAQIERGLKSGAEVGVIGFLRKDVERLFPHLETFGPRVRERIAAYRGALDPRLATVYVERRKFEESVTRLNEAISSYLDLEEQTAQGMFPHYFEKQKTDGVDYQMYVGASLLEDGGYDPLYLKNLRLWQLMVSCGIALRAEQIRERLPVPLETTHLVLVQHAPLAIRFRFDEKRFDVDGAYDIRYEIVKKRIDKALIRGTSDRVTQPGKIAIVYSQSAEAVEYRGYIEYLQSLGYLDRGIEELELEELQGVHGLRALRVTVDLKNTRAGDTPAASLLETSKS
jgi:GAF domain-containing protein